jgi:peptidoglycan/LPS O-acetylase OafA/YrhL
MSGMMLCDLYVNGYLTRLRHPAFKGVLLILGFYLAGYNINLTPDQIEGGAYSWVLATLSLTKNLFFPGWLVVIAGATLLLTLVINSTILQKLFASRLGKFMGKISFSLYLIHYSVLLTLGFNLFWRWQGLYGYHLAVLLSLAICLPVIIALSYLVYLTVDRASHQLGKNFYRAVVQKSLAAINWTALSHRCSFFFIKLRPVRTPQQEEALHG